MAPPNTDAVIQEFEKLNLQQLARTEGNYLVYPKTKVKRNNAALSAVL